jgi:hypothetical protein
MANKQIPTEGQFFISVDGNRLKQHPDNTVYLDNGREFQLEVFNPTTSKILAKIKINGNYISNTGLVLKPGQRVFLERYLDEAKKFKFETYNVESTPETQAAIANNGMVEVEFYKEYVTPISTCTYTYIPPIWNNNVFYCGGTTGNPIGGSFTTTLGYGSSITCGSTDVNIGGASTYTSTLGSVTNTSSIGQASFNASNASTSSLGSLQGGNSQKTDAFSSLHRAKSVGKKEKSSLEFDESLMDSYSRKIAATETKETGRVESGSHSNQSFVTDYATYNSWASNRVTWKILPLSQKPLEASDIKNYCSSCGARIKKSSWSFCPQCGNKF